MLRRRIIAGGGGEPQWLFQPVEWIKNTLGAYIDTEYTINGDGVIIEGNMTLEIAAATGSTSDKAYRFGNTSADSSQIGLVLTREKSVTVLQIANTNASNLVVLSNQGTSDKNYIFSATINATAGNATLTLNGTTQTTTNLTGLDARKMYIFGRNKGGTAEPGGPSTLYYFKIRNSNGVWYRNFVPCYRKADGVIGLYDTVGKKFYTNQGTGSFTKGNDTSWPG